MCSSDLEETNAIISAYNKRIIDAETQHDKDTITVNNARIAAGRVQVKYPTCPNTTASSTDTGAEGRVLHDRMVGAFENLRQGTERLLASCDTLNIDAIRLNGEIK